MPEKNCTYCLRVVDTRGLANHERTCPSKPENLAQAKKANARSAQLTKQQQGKDLLASFQARRVERSRTAPSGARQPVQPVEQHWEDDSGLAASFIDFTRFFTEPWTANTWWDIQSKLPPSPQNKVLPIIIYADKSKLSSFGTQKGYPVVARLANMHSAIRNGIEWGGGQFVGWLPVVEEDAKHSGKAAYVNFKNAVWHTALFKLLESVVLPSKIGVSVRCGDGELRRLFPVILILASDYEESCIMALIRGLNADYPCPICYVKQEDQLDLSSTQTLRSKQISERILNKARGLPTKGEREALLKKALPERRRAPKNVFWKMAYSDPHRAISFDRLHTYSLGIWGSHLFEHLKTHLLSRSSGDSAKFDSQFREMPRWSDLARPRSVVKVSFNDGSKHDDISRMALLASHNILTSTEETLFLCCVRSYQELNMYASKGMHTSETIAAGRQKLLNFESHLEAYIDAVEDTELEKNWCFIKMHLQSHLFDHIEQKGVCRNFGTQYDEAMHGSTRDIYLNQTNFKEVASQVLSPLFFARSALTFLKILKFEHRSMICRRIRAKIDNMPTEELEARPAPTNRTSKQSRTISEGNISRGSATAPITLEELEATGQPAYSRFRLSLSAYLNVFLPAYEQPLPHNTRVNLRKTDTITPYQYVKVEYQSADDWSDQSDILRCNPDFHSHARYDCALVKTSDGDIFVRLLLVFRIVLEDREYSLVLVHPLDAPHGRASARDKQLKLFPRSRKTYI
ncbi:hypothetical protein MKEN_00289900 [Mycena kentingensis (nom. inval.)]|nr:hypothetical protein MKEN_00289900 [Mycena kentingensis (nom. inval.)]